MWHVPLLALASRWLGSKRVTLPIPKYTKDDVLLLKELDRGGDVPGGHRPRRTRSSRSIEATKYVEAGQKTGNVVLTLNGGPA